MRMSFALPVAAALLFGCESQQREANSSGAPAPPVAATPVSPIAPTVKLAQYVSSKPLFLNVVFGEKSAKNMLLVLDESKGDGKGYDVAFVDDNMDGDLTNHPALTFASIERGAEKQLDPRFSFTGPCPYRQNGTAKYELDLYALAGKDSKNVNTKDVYLFWWLNDSEGWTYFFINGKVELYATAAEALRGQPLKLAGKCGWSLTARQQGDDVALSVGLKDPNGCTLRSVSAPNGRPTPSITLLDKGGRELVKDKKLEFG